MVVGFRIMVPNLDGALWFVAHEDHKGRVFASLAAHTFIRNDQRRLRRDDFRNAVNRVPRYVDTVERCECWTLVRRSWCFAILAVMARSATWIGLTAVEGNGAPTKVAAALRVAEHGVDMRA